MTFGSAAADAPPENHYGVVSKRESREVITEFLPSFAVGRLFPYSHSRQFNQQAHPPRIGNPILDFLKMSNCCSECET